jgi:hypothetical protein
MGEAGRERDEGRREEQERAAEGAAERGDEPGEHRPPADEEVADWAAGDVPARTP